MLRRCCLWLALLIVGGALVAGCGGVRPRDAGAVGKQASRSGPPRKNGRGEDSALQKRAAAHAHYATGVIHEMNGEPELALQEFYQAALNDPEDEALILVVSQRLLQSKQPQKALEVLAPAAARSGASGAVLAQIGSVYSQLGKSASAVKANREAIKKLPRSLASYQNLYLSYLQAKQPQEALAVLDEAAKLKDIGTEFLIGLADLYASYSLQFPAQREAIKARALSVLNRVPKKELANPQLRLKLADDFILLGDTEHATEQLEAIIRDDPANAPAYYYLGRIANDGRRWATAAEQFKKALLFSPDFEQAYYDLARVQIATNQMDEAQATLERAQRKFGRTFYVEYLTGAAFSQQKNYTEAITHFSAAETIARATAPALLTQVYFQLGAAFERKGDYAEAEKEFQKSLQLWPEFADALNYLGYMWAEHDTNLARARQLIEKAVKLEPDNAAFLDSMGWVLFKLNQPKEALDYIIKAVKLNGEPDATIYDHLGDIYATLKDPDKAREAWRKSLSVEPNDAVRKKLEAPKAN